MKKAIVSAFIVSTMLTAHAQLTAGDLVVVRVGDGVTTPASSAGPISLLDLTTSGSIQSTIGIPSGTGGLQVSGTATSEGQLILNGGGQSFTIAGYVPPYGGSGSLSGRSAVNAPRGYATVGLNGSVSAVTTLTGNYSAQNIRSGFVSGTGAWFAGSGTSAGSGVVYYNGTSSSTIQGVNSRVLGYYGGNLFYSTGSGTQGIYEYSGLPTAATTSTAFLTGVAGQGTSPYDFVFSPDGQSLYVADDAIGVQKFSLVSGSWVFDYNFTDGLSSTAAYGLAVDFSGVKPVVYWTSPTTIWAATDNGAGVLGTGILNAGTDYAFRGLEFVPTPEPATMALAGFGMAAMLILRRNRKA